MPPQNHLAAVTAATLTKFAAAAVIGLLLGSAAQAQAQVPAPTQSPAARKDARPASVTVISPIYGQLVRFSMPANFVAAFEKDKDNFYIREAVLRGETVESWSQMITVTGFKGLAANPQFSPQGHANAIAGGFKKACPESFAAKVFGAAKYGDHDALIAVAGCGKIGADKHSETALIIVIKGSQDAYTLQWAERGGGSSSSPVIDDAKWQARLRALMPIRLCAIVAGEAMPYPSCVQQK